MSGHTIKTLQRYDNDKLIDDLVYNYSGNGNQVWSITDYAEPSDMYSITEYYDTHSDTSLPDMLYDKNGNLTSDKDRGISCITYNILNLPDTIQFANGNQIVNLYRADGYKYKSIYFSVIRTMITPYYEIMHYDFDSDSTRFYVKEFNHNFERHYSSTDTTIRILNKEGYYQNGAYYYHYTDHLGNNCAVRNATTGSIVQRTMYYASGVPMSTSWGQHIQDKKYNGKEYVTAYGYDTYDYGFRGYYATIGRFTSMDPMAELTPWQSPYVYAKNNGVAHTDYMGLVYMQHGKRWFSSIDEEPLQYTEIDNDGVVVFHRDDDEDKRVMIVKDDGSKKEIGSELEDEKYVVGHRAYFRWSAFGGIRMVYNYQKAISVAPYTPWDVRVARWLRAQGVDEWEEKTIEAQRPFLQGIVLAIPILSQYNDIKTLTTGENIYGTPADEKDYILSTMSLLTFGVGNVVTNKTVKNVLEGIGWLGTSGSVGKTIKEGYDTEEKGQ